MKGKWKSKNSNTIGSKWIRYQKWKWTKPKTDDRTHNAEEPTEQSSIFFLNTIYYFSTHPTRHWRFWLKIYKQKLPKKTLWENWMYMLMRQIHTHTRDEGEAETSFHKIHVRQLRMASLVVTLNENNSRNKSAASDLVDSVFAIFGITQNDRKCERTNKFAQTLAPTSTGTRCKTRRRKNRTRWVYWYRHR